MKDINHVLESFYVSNPSFKECEIELIKQGHNRSVYSISNGEGKKYIVKIGNENKDLGAANLNDVRSQNFLVEMGCAFIPKAFFWDETDDYYVETFVGDVDINFNDLSETELDTLAKQLAFVHEIPATKYQQFCEDHGFEIPEIITPIKDLEIYGFDRFKIVKQLNTDQNIINWLDEHLKESREEAGKHDYSIEKAHMKWGDIGENLRKDENGLYFVDWEFSKPGFGSELAYIKIHSHLSPEKFNFLKSRYAKHSGMTERELDDEITMVEKITRVNDVVWAAMKWVQAKTSEDIEKYKELTSKRISLAENNT